MSEEARKLFRESLEAGYSPADAKKRVAKFMTTGEIEADPTEGVWKGLIKQESGGRQSAVSSKGARGIAQVMPATAPEAAALAGVDWDPNAYRSDSGYNGQIGRAYLRKQFADFGNPELALAAYNAGPGAVRRAGGDLSRLPKETQNYVPAIMGQSEPQDMALQPELDSPEDIAAAKEALAQPRDKAKQAFMDALEKGGSLDDAKAAARAVLAPPQAAPAPQELNNEGDPIGGDNPAGGEYVVRKPDPVARQEQLMSGGMLDRFTGGLERSMGGVDRGVKKLLGQILGNEEMVKKSERQEQAIRDVVEKYDPTGSGISAADLGRLTGDAAAFAVPGSAIGKATAGAGTVLGPALGGAITGSLQGLLQPTTEDQSQGVNAAMGAGLGGLLGGAGGVLTRLIGTRDAGRAAAADTLRQTGVEVPRGFDYESPLSNVLRKAGGSRGSGQSLDDNLTRALSERLGLPEGTGITNEALEQNKRVIGGQIGNLTRNFTGAADDQFVVDLSNASRNYRLSGPMSAGQRAKIDHLRQIAASGRNISGQEYQALRTGLTEDATKGGAAEKNLNSSLRNALDDMFERQNNTDELAGLRGQYRLSSILRNGSGVPTEGYTAKAIRNRLESAAGKGRVDPETRRLIQNAADLAPGSAIGGEAVGGASSAEAAINRLSQPTLMGVLAAGLRGVAGPASRGYDSGMLQGLTNNETTRLALINLLRGGTIPITSQLYTSGEE